MKIDIAKQKIRGLDYMLQRLALQSAAGRAMLSDLVWYEPGSEKDLDIELARVDALREYMDRQATVPLDKLKLKFSQVWDIRPTFKLLERETADDVQFFEIKRFAILVQEASAYLEELVRACAFHPAPQGFPDLSAVVEILDPRGENLPVFRIYDEYDSTLAAKRKELLHLDSSLAETAGGECSCHCGEPDLSRSQRTADSGFPGKTGSAGKEEKTEKVSGRNDGNRMEGVSFPKYMDQETARLQSECEELERAVRERLSLKLRPFAGTLQQAMDRVAYWDMLAAKADLAYRYGLVRPRLQSFRNGEECQDRSAASGLNASGLKEKRICYRGLFHPAVKESLQAQKHRYQPVDIDLGEEACLLTGANMSGKTVLLKSLAVSQCLLQFGFPVAAEEASLVLFDDVDLMVHDEQDEERGLSSFGAEIQSLNRVFGRIRAGERILLLVDELARTTNPVEGKAIVCAVLDYLKDFRCVSLISTHFGPISNAVRRLRVRGFREDWAQEMTEEGGNRERNREGNRERYPGSGENGNFQQAVSGELACRDSAGFRTDAGQSRLPVGQETASFDISKIQSCMDYSVGEEQEGGQPPMEALRIASLLGFDRGILQKAYGYCKENERKCN